MATLPVGFRSASAEPIRLPDGLVARIPKALLTLPRWRGAPFTTSGASWQTKPLVAVSGQPMFAELAVWALLATVGWETRWVEAYGVGSEPLYLTEWQDAPLAAQNTVPIAAFAVRTRLAANAAANAAAIAKVSYAGCWDVLAWDDGPHLLFVEVKRTGRDQLQPTQAAWLEAAFRCGLTTQNFLLVEWDFPR